MTNQTRAPFSLDKFLFFGNCSLILSFLPKKYKYTVLWSIIQNSSCFSKITNLHKFPNFIVNFSHVWVNPKSPKFLKLHFDVFDDFFHDNSIRKKTFICADNGFFSDNGFFFPFWPKIRLKKTVIIIFDQIFCPFSLILTKKTLYHKLAG